MNIHVSVVVPTFKRPDLLERCLTALSVQKFPPAHYEIIIVDDAVSEQTRVQVERWAKIGVESGYTVRYVPVKGARHGPALARNIGWRCARGEIIAFTDDDCIPEMSWLSAGVAAFKDGVAAVSGRILVPLPPDPTDYERNAAGLEHSEFVTANCFYRCTTLQQYGGFDERFTAAWREDSDLFFTLLEHNERCIHVPEAVVLHPVRPARWGISLFQQRKSLFNALLYKKHPDLYRRRVQARPPWHYYCIVGTIFVGLLAIIAQLWLLLLGAFILWGYMTAHFCLRRLRKTSHASRYVIEMIITSILIPPLTVFWRLYGSIKFHVWFL